MKMHMALHRKSDIKRFHISRKEEEEEEKKKKKKKKKKKILQHWMTAGTIQGQ